MLYYHRQPEKMTEALNILNKIFVSIMCLFFVTRVLLISSMEDFFRSYHHKLFLFITLILTIASFSNNDSSRELKSVARACQVILSYQIVKKFNIVQRLFHTIFLILPSLANIVSLMLLIIYIYAIIGMVLFCYIKEQEVLNGVDVDFKSFFRACHSLIRVMSAEMWFLVVADITRERAPNFVCFDIKNYDDYAKYGKNNLPYFKNLKFFFLNFKMIFNTSIINNDHSNSTSYLLHNTIINNLSHF
jgi:hypothetical protein